MALQFFPRQADTFVQDANEVKSAVVSAMLNVGKEGLLDAASAGFSSFLVITVVTGVPNSGKSEWIDDLVCNLNHSKNWIFALCSMENKVWRIHTKITSGRVRSSSRNKSIAILNAESTDLANIFRQLNSNPEVKVIIITGSGRAFCSGVDLTAAQEVFKGDVKDESADPLIQMEKCSKPIIGAINGLEITRFHSHVTFWLQVLRPSSSTLTAILTINCNWRHSKKLDVANLYRIELACRNILLFNNGTVNRVATAVVRCCSLDAETPKASPGQLHLAAFDLPDLSRI
ncbi:hypothetical protein SELMODRAFT_421553 [Selaginella moellendorffii]|uniref:3-hydroxyisobutyryl-coenzyme A hydrolase n=1 Tax=Selaginella moellendorffii TaxID=88036 RepID=D8SFM4_SELML|nr:hypothetical protein SELMODRAFT_421553 [Selaginella moellendorffii]